MGKVKVVVADALKKPSTAFWLWQTANRDCIVKAAGATSAPEVSRKAAEMWQKVTPAEKKPLEEQYKQAKEKYDAYLKTPEGQEAMKALKEERKEAKLENTKTEMKKAAKAVERDEALKKPLSGYFLWLNANREKITKAAGSSKGSDVSKKAAEMWKAASDAEKAPFETEAKAQKEKYEAYLKTPEGEKAMQEFKAAQAAAKAEVKGADKVEAASPKKDKKESPKKRKAKDPSDSPRKARKTANAFAVPTLSVEQRANAGELGASLETLASRADIRAKGCSVDEMLEALKSNCGLVHPAKRALLGA